MLDHAFQRRREIERMLLSGKKLTVSELMGRYCVGRYGRGGRTSEFPLAGTIGMPGTNSCFL